MPTQPSPKIQERQPLPLEKRHQIYSEMLDYLTLLPKHKENLLERGLSEERIERNQYRSMPETGRGRRLLASLLRANGHDLIIGMYHHRLGPGGLIDGVPWDRGRFSYDQ